MMRNHAMIEIAGDDAAALVAAVVLGDGAIPQGTGRRILPQAGFAPMTRALRRGKGTGRAGRGRALPLAGAAKDGTTYSASSPRSSASASRSTASARRSSTRCR